MSQMRIGIDFDNTIIDYDKLFIAEAIALGLVSPDFAGRKKDLRDAIRQTGDGETEWMRLQGRIYGAKIGGAVLMPGVDKFFERCRDTDGVTVFIVSHKTEFGHFDEARISLRDAALGWMNDHRFFSPDGFAIPRDNVFFETTRDDKLRRIASLDCAWFIDDLEEVLGDAAFPAAVTGILFTNGAGQGPDMPGPVCADWRQIEEAVFGHRG